MFGKNFLEAIKQLAEEKNIDRDVVIKTIEAALAAAYRKDYGSPDQNIKVELNEKSGNFKVFDEKTVVKELDEEMEKREREFILLDDAKKKDCKFKPKDKDSKIEEGTIVRIEITPEGTEPKRNAEGSRIKTLEIMLSGGAAALSCRVGRVSYFGAA